MSTLMGRICSIVLVAAALIGLSGNLAWAIPDNTNGCEPSGNQPNKCSASVTAAAGTVPSTNSGGSVSTTSSATSVPEPSSLILLGAGFAGFGIWVWAWAWSWARSWRGKDTTV